MSAVKFPHPPSSAAGCSIRGSLLTLAIITLVSFTYLSLKSLQSPSLQSSSSATPPNRTVLVSLPEEVDDADVDNVAKVIVPEKTEGESDNEDDDVYHSPKVFRLNYEEMLRRFKVYIYKDGDPKTYYQTPRKLTGKYSSEGYFFQNLRESSFLTDDPDQADLFFIPISCHKMRGKGISYENMTLIVQNYVESLMSKYPYWNRTLGADHFFVTCHDVGVRATEGLPHLVKNSIRVVCSPSYDVGFIPHKDVALPQILQPFALPAGGNDVENRTTLGFWAGHRNSKIRVILARVWENDTELDISNNRISRSTGHLVYQKRFYRTKFCICPGGSQVNSARITDSIHYGCIPVILSDYYDLPFNDILNWHKFAVVLKEKDVYQLKEILKKITQDEFVTLHNNLVKIQKHFQWNSPPVKHDAFHMSTGDDGRGYELARKLESHGVWRTWLGDAVYSTFIQYLTSPAAWDAFMRADESKTKPQIQLQLRARALLFDKASVSLFTRRAASSPAPISKLNPNYLELHGDDVYFTLENGAQDGDQRQSGLASTNTTSSKGHSKTSSSVGSRFNESEIDAVLPETWYTQFFEKYRASKSYRSMFGDRESEKRSPERMSTYLRVLENHKRRRVAFKENVSNLRSNSVMGDSNAVDDTPLFPETMFTLNCVPDSAVVQTHELQNIQKLQFNGVLDNLPEIMTKNPRISNIMIERLGIRPEYLNMEQGHQTRGKNGRKLIGQEQASQMSQKVVARLLSNVGFESSSDAPLEVLAQFLSCHISKLGRILKLLSDSYKKQCSATELLRMFLQTAGYSNLGTLAELIKDNSKNIVQQTQQQVLGIQAQLQSQQQSLMQPSQQIIRQMNPQMQQQMNNPQYLAFQQQQWERMRRRQQQSTPRPGMNVSLSMDKERPMVQVKMENSDFPLDTNNFTAMNQRHPQLQQFRQQQLAAMSSLHAQANNAFRPMTSLQTPQVLSPNMGMARAPPVKVEGFQELMGGDSSMKHESEENKLLSPK